MLNWTTTPRSWSTTWVLLGLVAAASAGCGDQGDAAQHDADAHPKAQQAQAADDHPDQHRKRFGNLSTDGLQSQSLDLNQDDTADQWTYKNAQQTVRIERDMNFDGKVDLWQYIDDAGEVGEEEMDLDLDGKIDVVAHYKDGVVSRKEMSVNFDDQFSIVKFYNKKGNLLRVERDQDADGTVDLWEYYNDDGRRERVGWDDDGDGVPDQFNNL